MIVSSRILSGLGVVAALLLWFSGTFSFWLIFLVAAVAIIGVLAAILTPTFTRPIMIGVGVVIIIALGANMVTKHLFTEGRYSYDALGRSKVESDMEWAERLDPHALKYRALLAEKCRAADDAAGEALRASLAEVNDLAFSNDLNALQAKQDEVSRIQRFRAKCREAVMQEKSPKEVTPSQITSAAGAVPVADEGEQNFLSKTWGWVTGSASSVANSTVVANAKAKADNTWSAIPFFTSKSGLVTLLGLVFIAIGWPTSKGHTLFGGGIMAAGVVMLLAGMGDWLSSQNSLFAQLRDAITGDYNHPWYVTVLAFTAIGVLLLALFGIETSIRFKTIAVALTLLGLAWFARPDTSLSDVSQKVEAKLGGVSFTLPSVTGIFGGWGGAYVPCSEHTNAFARVGKGGEAACWQDLAAGESMKIDFHAADRWWMSPGDEPGVRVELFKGGSTVYKGRYVEGRMPRTTSMEVTNGGSPRRFYVRIKG